ncbi:alpha-1,2-fucosyltransferase [Vibrio ishigakensis]|uniref:Alpha-1,2-fucosyltransferase n=1 Tax=Vibrio ishigakensis TaxID=1481914 RepID=A0A0B8P903_9VIBR|nr:alpha-1,2-fucosyltransferase [Vibrio ishigakensis]
MIVVKVIGGLGNQLFQIAYAIALSKERNNCQIYLDISAFDKYKIRPFSASNLNLPDNISILDGDTLPASKTFFYSATQIMYRITQRILKEIGFKYQYGKIPHKLLQYLGLIYNFDTYFYRPTVQRSNLCLYGYFQNENYFKRHKLDIVHAFINKKKLDSVTESYKSKITQSTAIAVSMRLGQDYIDSGDFYICSGKYYKEGLDRLKERYPEADIFVFSDDIDKAKNILDKEVNITFIEQCSDCSSLYLMSLCDHFVIANSSFSWWGSYLGTNPKKSIIAPKNWFIYMDEVNNIYTENMELI